MPAGRPRVIESPEEFEELATAYFKECEEKKERPLLTGLILALGLASRGSLAEYEKRDEFLYSVKRAKMVVEHAYEQMLGGAHAAGPIFALKNFNWTDKQEHQVSGPGGGPIEQKWTVEVVDAKDADTE